MYSLTEIVEAQQKLQEVDFNVYTSNLVDQIESQKLLSRKTVKHKCLIVAQLIAKFGSKEQTLQFQKLYDKIYKTVYHYEKQLVLQKRMIKTFVASLALIQEQYIQDIENSKQQFSDIFELDLDNYFNFFKLNTILLKRKYSDSFDKKKQVVKRRITQDIAKHISQTFWTEREEFYKALTEITDLANQLDTELELLNKQKTQELLKSRKEHTLSGFLWNTEQDYLEYAQNWKNDWIIDKFLGIAGQYVTWKHPVAYIDPNIGELTRHIISGDPFYVIDDLTTPCCNIVDSLPAASQHKVFHYTKQTAATHLEKSSIQVCVSWNNFPFATQGNINKNIKLMSELLKPGGYAIFNYADAHSAQGAKFCENYIVPVVWKERIDRYAAENNLTEISYHNYPGYPFSIAVYQKDGKSIDLNITNKLGLVLPNEKQLQIQRLEESEENLKIRAARSKLEDDLKRLKERDKLLRDLDKQRQLGNENILEAKLKKAINHLNSMISAYNDYTHPSVLESLLHVSKITYSIGRVKDSKNLIKRVERDIAKMSEDNFIGRKYREWQNFLNNIDT